MFRDTTGYAYNMHKQDTELYMKRNIPMRIVQRTRSHKLTNIKAISLGVLLIAALGLSAFAFYRTNQKNVNEQHAEQAKTLTDSVNQSKAGKCQDTLDDLKKIVSSSSVEPNVEADSRYLIGECLLTTKDYEAGVDQLKKAEDLYTKYGDTDNARRSKLLIEQAQTEINNAKREPAPVQPSDMSGHQNG